MNRFRTPALTLLYLQVVAVFLIAGYALEHGGFKSDAWITATEAFLAGLVLAWWTVILGRITAGQALAEKDGTLRALGGFFPWLTALRYGLWGLTLLGLLAGVAPEANTVALTALMTIWGGAIWASNAVNGGLVRLALEPENISRASHLSDWLNTSAALSLGMTVLNIVPIKGFSSAPDPTSQLVYGLGGLLDVLATLAAFLAVQEWQKQLTKPEQASP